MLLFFKNPKNTIYVVATEATLTETDLNKLKWLFGNAQLLPPLPLAVLSSDPVRR